MPFLLPFTFLTIFNSSWALVFLNPSLQAWTVSLCSSEVTWLCFYLLQPKGYGSHQKAKRAPKLTEICTEGSGAHENAHKGLWFAQKDVWMALKGTERNMERWRDRESNGGLWDTPKRHMEDTEVHWKLYRGLWGCCFTQDLSACWQCQPGRARKASSLGSGTGEDTVLPLQLWDQVPKEKMGLGTHPVHHANFLHLSG